MLVSICLNAGVVASRASVFGVLGLDPVQRLGAGDIFQPGVGIVGHGGFLCRDGASGDQARNQADRGELGHECFRTKKCPERSTTPRRPTLPKVRAARACIAVGEALRRRCACGPRRRCAPRRAPRPARAGKANRYRLHHASIGMPTSHSGNQPIHSLVPRAAGQTSTRANPARAICRTGRSTRGSGRSERKEGRCDMAALRAGRITTGPQDCRSPSQRLRP